MLLTVFFAFCVGGVAVFIVNYLHTTLPKDIAEPWKLKLLLAVFRLVRLIPYIAEQLEFGSNLDIDRMVTSWVFKLVAERIPSDHLQIQDMEMEGVKVRIYRPKSANKAVLPGLAYYHGGGFIVFDVDTYDNVLRKISIDANIVVMGVERSPEHAFPIPLQDCVKTTVYFINNAAEFGVDQKRIGVAGDSAGGNLAAATARKLSYELSDVIHYPIKYQALVYPMVQAFDFQLPSFIVHTQTMPEILSTELVTSAWAMYWTGQEDFDASDFMTNSHINADMKRSHLSSYASRNLLPEHYNASCSQPMKTTYTNDKLAEEFKSSLLNPYYCPLLADDVSRLPSTFILTAEFDVLRDDGLLYSKRLKDAGIDVDHVHITNGYHGIFSFTKFQIGKDAVTTFVRYIKDIS